jgi:uncharacterized protein (DUF983 family)
MSAMSTLTRLALRNRCPHCETGPIYSGFFMNDTCPHCRYRYYRESGYFLGSMILSYFASSGLGIFIMLLLFIAYQVEIVPAAIAAVLAVAVVMPIFSRISRILWIRLDYLVNPGRSD